MLEVFDMYVVLYKSSSVLYNNIFIEHQITERDKIKQNRKTEL